MAIKLGRDIDVDSCCSQLLWIKQQISEYGINLGCTPSLCDNTSAVNKAKNSVQHKPIKHIKVRHHFLRYFVKKGLIEMVLVEMMNKFLTSSLNYSF